jgi:hypothetical protein
LASAGEEIREEVARKGGQLNIKTILLLKNNE